MTEKVIVKVNEGRVRGFKTKTVFSGAEYYSFLGIPYGQTTEGSARFKDPVRVKPWNHIFDATVERTGCSQFSLHFKKLIGSEDCLYNNIYTPKLPLKGDPLKAVIVNIHPGGYFHGSPDPTYYGAPDFLMHHDIVYVSIGYRLHVLGHLNMHLESCSGNQSLKDIILGLQWIKENINVFGGDPENITLIGSSSGSASVHYLLLSPMAKGLYHKAIMMGMYIFSPVIVYPPDHDSVAYDIARKIGFEGQRDEHKKLLKFYKKVDLPTFILARSEHYFNRTELPVFPTSPFLPTDEPGKNTPLPLPMRELIPGTNRVPIMVGFCEREGAMALAILRTFKRSISECFLTLIRQNIYGWGANLSIDELKQIQKEVESFYLEGESIETAPQDTLCDILSDAALSDVYDSLINVVSADLPSSVYVYNFHYDGKLCTMKTRMAQLMEKRLQGAFHAGDYSYWCYSEETAGRNMGCISPKDREMINTFTSLLTTFAKTSNPNDYEGMKVNWKPTKPECPSHLIINDTLEARDEVLNGERLEFWHKLKTKFTKSSNDV
ncbi:esterase E4-like [Planococcus citri]|uniref:esterase E4-like n=1 Tax=Planococcus citri TaxID=170843 RepID=UPI0031F885EF